MTTQRSLIPVFQRARSWKKIMESLLKCHKKAGKWFFTLSVCMSCPLQWIWCHLWWVSRTSGQLWGVAGGFFPEKSIINLHFLCRFPQAGSLCCSFLPARGCSIFHGFCVHPSLHIPGLSSHLKGKSRTSFFFLINEIWAIFSLNIKMYVLI